MRKFGSTMQAGVIGLWVSTIAGAVASADETVVSALSSWNARGELYQTGPTEATFAGVFSGVLYVEGDAGAVDAGLMVCPGRMHIDTGALSQSGSADCTIMTADGDRIYADFSCEGEYRAGCYGELTLVGGTGGREGIVGGGPVEFLNSAPDWLSVPGNIIATEGVGLLRLPSLSFQIP